MAETKGPYMRLQQAAIGKRHVVVIDYCDDDTEVETVLSADEAIDIGHHLIELGLEANKDNGVRPS